MKKKFSYFLIRIFGILIFIVVLGWIYELAFYPALLKSEGWMKEVGEKSYSKKAEVMYFSASPNSSCPENDVDKRSIVQRMQDLCKDKSFASLDAGSLHGGVYLHALHQLPRNYNPEIIVMDLNLRSLSIRWLNSGLENAMQRNLSYWNNNPGLYNRINAALKNYEYYPLSERNKWIDREDKFQHLPFKGASNTVHLWIDSLNRLPDRADKMGQEMVQHFGFVLNDQNRMLRYYDEIVAFCSARKIELYLLILPENLEGMELKAGKQLRTLCLENGRFLEQHFQTKSLHLINLLDQLPDSLFYESYPTEHYRSDGKNLIARKVIEEIKRKQ